MEQLLASLPTLLLVSCRVAGLTTASPVFANPFFPVRLRVFFTFLLAAIITPAIHAPPGVTEGTGLALSCLLELLTGLVMGFLGQLVFAAVQMAGALLDLDMGFSMAQIMDPISGHSDPIMSSFFRTLALVIYLAMDGHHLLIGALATSYKMIAVGGSLLTQGSALQIVDLFGTMLAAAVQMVLPLMAAMLIATVALGGISRAVPQMQIFGSSMGIKTLAGLALLMVLLRYLPGYLQSLFTWGQTVMLQMMGSIH